MKLTISKKSWHYRYFNWLDDLLPDGAVWFNAPTACGYTWGLFFTHVKAALILFFLAAIACGVFMLTVGVLILAWSAFVNGSDKALVFMLLLLVLDAFIITLILMEKYNFEREFRNKVQNAGFIKLMKATGSSFKTKVCPLVEYKE